jgi:HEPN domain-containing protein
MTKERRNYLIWQNRSLRFYLGSRLCYLNGLASPAAFCAQQALELLLKATLIYSDRSFDPDTARHRFPAMLRTLENKVRGSHAVKIPEYFYSDRRYQSVSRYPTNDGKGVLIPATFLDDLDQAFCDLIALIPFHFNTQLVCVIDGRGLNARKSLLILRRRNRQIRKLRRFLCKWARPRRNPA